MESNWRYIDGISLFNEMLHGWSLLHEILATCNIVLNIIIKISFYLFQRHLIYRYRSLFIPRTFHLSCIILHNINIYILNLTYPPCGDFIRYGRSPNQVTFCNSCRPHSCPLIYSNTTTFPPPPRIQMYVRIQNQLPIILLTMRIPLMLELHPRRNAMMPTGPQRCRHCARSHILSYRPRPRPGMDAIAIVVVRSQMNLIDLIDHHHGDLHLICDAFEDLCNLEYSRNALWCVDIGICVGFGGTFGCIISFCGCCNGIENDEFDWVRWLFSFLFSLSSMSVACIGARHLDTMRRFFIPENDFFI